MAGEAVPKGIQMSDWTTPKQIKIERDKPRCRNRGIFKGKRHKGRKARIDEILSAKQHTLRYRDWIVSEWKRFKEHPEWYRPNPALYRWKPYHPRYDEWFDRENKNLNQLLVMAINDKVLTYEEAKEYQVEKPWAWPFQRINSNGAREYACSHGIGHGGLHGCDGCCQSEEAKLAIHYQSKPKEAE